MHSKITDAVRENYAAVATSTYPAIRKECARCPGLWLFARGTRVDTGGGQHGAFVWQSDGLCQPPDRRGCGDLGCGGGLDVFLAAAKVGPTGKAIGIDMTPEMLERARANAAKNADGKLTANVEFHLATIDNLPLPDASVDCVISNCVINLAPDKPAVFREIARVLKPGGRLAVSDLVIKQSLPPEVAQDVLAYVGCIAGAICTEDYRTGLLAAGFGDVDMRDTGADLSAYCRWRVPRLLLGDPSLWVLGMRLRRVVAGLHRSSRQGEMPCTEAIGN